MDLVNDRRDVIQNIYTIYNAIHSEDQTEAEDAKSLLARGWVFVVEKIGNQLFFAPSRFIGYKNNSIALHNSNDEKHGGITNIRLSKIYGIEQVNDMLVSELKKFLALFNITRNYEVSTPFKFFYFENDLGKSNAVYFISPTHVKGQKEASWKSFLNSGIVAIGWYHTDYSGWDWDRIQENIQLQNFENERQAITAFENLISVKPGDVIVCTNASQGIFGIGIATSGYKFQYAIHDSKEENKEDWYSHYIDVSWIKKEYIGQANIKNNLNESWWEPYGTISYKNPIPSYILDLINKSNHKILPTAIKTVLMIKHPLNQILQGPPGTGKTRRAKEIAYELIFNEALSANEEERKEQLKSLNKNDQFKLIQFHPAYSYEDFVRGITAKTNGSQIEYKAVDKILAKIAIKATDNYLDSLKESSEIAQEDWIVKKFEEYKKTISTQLKSSDKKYLVGNSGVSVVELTEHSFMCLNDNYYKESTPYPFKFKKFINLYKDYLTNSNQNTFNTNSLSKPLVVDFEKFIGKIPDFSKSSEESLKLKNYVLIIDEINRANLPAVLGELIYALEYRGETVNIMYDIDGETEIVLPPNLYIIGTMNTADRSVGHIDYAIRRRFAFVNVFPNEDVITNEKAKAIFTNVQVFFTNNTSSDFETQDVCLGHSYFIVKDDQELKQKLKYEVLPILKEYIKDGVLNKNQETTDFVNYINTQIESLGA